eukprot:6432207-Amphidinium_carterae.1
MMLEGVKVCLAAEHDDGEGCAGHCYEKDDQPPYSAKCRDLEKGSSPYGFYHFVRVYRTLDFKVNPIRCSRTLALLLMSTIGQGA